MTSLRGERLGSGAVTETFVATSFGAEGFEKTVVEKRVHPALAAIPRFVDAFVAEAQRASALSHANVVLLMDVARDASGYRLVTEYVDGVDLARLLELSRAAGVVLPAPLVAFIGAEVAKGLDYAHRRRGGAVVHGGLSLTNVLVSRDGAVKISDFGVHRAREDAGFAPDELRARPFRSPERLAGGEATKAADVFALGAILRELTKGGPAFEPAEALAGPEDARPTAGAFHETILAWAYARGGLGASANELAKLVARLQRDTPSRRSRAVSRARWTRPWSPRRAARSPRKSPARRVHDRRGRARSRCSW
ncbi:MAG: protein kinase [Polyangiaceae bacterium]